MKMHVRIHDQPRRAALLIAVALVVTSLLSSAVWAQREEPASTGLRAAREQVRRARTLEKFALLERGNLAQFDEALDALKTAESSLGTSGAEDSEARALDREIGELRTQIDAFRAAAERTFFGQFPLVRTFGEPRGEPPMPVDNLIGNARRKALRAALAAGRASLPAGLVSAVVVLTDADGNEIDDASFKELVDFELASMVGVAANLVRLPPPSKRQSSVPDWKASDLAFVPLCRELLTDADGVFRSRDLLLIIVRDMSVGDDGYYWTQVQWRAFSAYWLDALAQSAQVSAFRANDAWVSEGLAHDVSPLWNEIVLVNVALAVLALLIHAAWIVLTRQPVTNWQGWILPPALGFAIGRLLPPTIWKALATLMPEPGANWLMSAWWPCLAGIVILLVPALVHRFLGGKLAPLVGSSWSDWRWGIAMVSVALGVMAYWFGYLPLAFGRDAWPLLVALSLSSCLVLYLFGRSIDSGENVSLNYIALAAIASVPIALALFQGNTTLAWGAVALALIGPTAIAVRRPPSVAHDAPASSPLGAYDGAQRPHSLAELRSKAMHPAYQRFAAFQHARREIAEQNSGRVSWIVLRGKSGCGKTALADEVIREVVRQQPRLRVLRGSCQPGGDPYHPFRQALADVWNTIGPANDDPRSAKLDVALQQLVGMFVPFWGVLSGLGRGDSSVASQQELHGAVAKALRVLSEAGPVLVFVDNFQWADESSLALIASLIEQFQPGDEQPLRFVFSTRDEAGLLEKSPRIEVVPVEMPSTAEQIRILSDSLQIAEPTARRIVDSMGSIAVEPGGLFWLSRVVVELVDADAFESTPAGFALKTTYSGGKLPVPEELRRILSQKLASLGGEKLILQCAAVVGQEFSVAAVSESLSLDRLSLLETLGRLQHEHGIVQDIPDDDDRCAFSSAFIREVICQEFGIGGERGAQGKEPKIIQELHARLATALAAGESASADACYALARHYFRAGSRFAQQSLEANLRAAACARQQFAYDRARRHVMLASRSAALANTPFDEQRQLFLIDSDEAHVSGRDRQAVADRGLALIADQRAEADCSFLLTVARACYDAGRDSEDQTRFKAAAELARRVIQQACSPSDAAEGFHLLAVSLDPSQRDDRTRTLRQGLLRLEESAVNDVAGALLKARMLGSLGEQLSGGTRQEQDEARRCFEQGLKLRAEHGGADLPGAARAHGGLGRLAFFNEPPLVDQARRHFEEDLRISKQIGDDAGVAMCHGFLARCSRAVGDLPGALRHYDAAAESAHAWKDRYFNWTGQLQVLLELNDLQAATKTAAKIEETMRSQPLPRSCAEELAAVLKQHVPSTNGAWATALAKQVDAVLGAVSGS